MPSSEGSTSTSPASPDLDPQRRIKVFAGANAGLNVLETPAGTQRSQILETHVGGRCNVKGMGVMKAGAFIFPICPVLCIFYVFWGEFPRVCYFITGIQSIYVSDFRRKIKPPERG